MNASSQYKTQLPIEHPKVSTFYLLTALLSHRLAECTCAFKCFDNLSKTVYEISFSYFKFHYLFFPSLWLIVRKVIY